MNIWTLPESSQTSDIAHATLISMIPYVGSPAFTTNALAEVNNAFHAGSWSVYRIFGEAPPICYLSNSFRRRDTTGACFSAYRGGLYHRDRSFETLRGSRSLPHLKVIHLAAGEVPNPEQRLAIYERYQLRERLSVAKSCTDGSILSVNLYRHSDQDGFRDRDLEIFRNLAPGLFALVDRQIQLCRPIPAARGASGEARHEAHRRALQRLAPKMPERELEVCTRLLRGMSHDGIACDLGIGATTVKTYRNRAFARLDIHHNNELFALVLRSVSDRDAG